MFGRADASVNSVQLFAQCPMSSQDRARVMLTLRIHKQTHISQWWADTWHVRLLLLRVCMRVYCGLVVCVPVYKLCLSLALLIPGGRARLHPLLPGLARVRHDLVAAKKCRRGSASRTGLSLRYSSLTTTTGHFVEISFVVPHNSTVAEHACSEM